VETPDWAWHLTDRVCRDEGVPPVDALVFWRSRRRHTTGRHWKRWRDGRSRISICAGTSGEHEHRGVLLHELAHHVSTQRGHRGHHDDRFWQIAWGLFQRYGVTPGFMQREFRYRAKAARVAIQMGIPGALETSASLSRWASISRRRVRPKPLEGEVLGQGEPVRFRRTISPRYAGGMRAEVVRPLVSRYEVRLLETRGRFRKGMLVRIGPEALLRRGRDGMKRGIQAASQS
jgi:hypothetical protein